MIRKGSIDLTLEDRTDLPLGLLGAEVNLTYYFHKGSPGCWYQRNGDPGDPPEPDEIEYNDPEVMFVDPEGEVRRDPRPEEAKAVSAWVMHHLDDLREMLDELVYSDLDDGPDPDAAREAMQDRVQLRDERENVY